VIDIVTSRVFLDAQGNIQEIDLKQNIVGTHSANGVSLPESDHFM